MQRGPRFWRGSSLWLLVPILLFACAGVPKNKGSGTIHIIEDVPFYPQETYQCGPASLAGVLSYWGLNIPPAEIAAEIYSPKARGTWDLDMVLFAAKRGLRASQYQGSLEDLKRNIDSNQPLVVLVDQGFWVYQKDHYMVVVGYEEGGLIVNSGKERHQLISLGRFLRDWERTNFWTLRITPK